MITKKGPNPPGEPQPAYFVRRLHAKLRWRERFGNGNDITREQYRAITNSIKAELRGESKYCDWVTVKYLHDEPQNRTRWRVWMEDLLFDVIYDHYYDEIATFLYPEY